LSGRTVRLRCAAVFSPLLEPARYKGAWGGRGSGKSHHFAEQIVARHAAQPGRRTVCIREVQKSLKESAKRLIEDKIAKFDLGAAQGFEVQREFIHTPGGGLVTFTGMQDHTADSVKSLEGFDCAWVEEAQSLSDRSLGLLRPTIRKEASELWFSWNPQRPTDPVDRLLRSVDLPTGACVVRANWSDNPWFPAVLEQERQDCLRMQPERYGHIWEGEYATVLEGAYYARHLTEAQLEGRIGFVARDPLLKVHAFWDIAGTGDRADAVAIWIVQFVGAEVRLLDYYEAVGQPFDAHVNWLRANGYEGAVCILPHDGARHDTVYAVTPQGFLGKAGFVTQVVPNQGRGAALQRIDAARQVFPSCRFHEERTRGGREALGWYHERRDEHRGIGLGPEHDFSSHGSDAFGLMAVWRLRHPADSTWGKPLRRNLKGIA
jgi:phage terminase large subunit